MKEEIIEREKINEENEKIMKKKEKNRYINLERKSKWL